MPATIDKAVTGLGFREELDHALLHGELVKIVVEDRRKGNHVFFVSHKFRVESFETVLCKKEQHDYFCNASQLSSAGRAALS